MKRLMSVLVAASIGIACGGGEAPGAATEAATESTTVPAAGGAAKPAPAAQAPQYREVTLPEGTELQLELQTAVASDTSRVEDVVRASLRQGIVIDGTTVLPAGVELAGVVTEVERSGRVSGRARVAYRFNALSRGADQYDIATAPTSHLAPATRGEDATKIAVGAGAGAVIGGLLGGGDGAAKGAAIGGAAGTGAVLATRGEEIRVGPGASVTTRLTSPVAIRVQVGR